MSGDHSSQPPSTSLPLAQVTAPVGDLPGMHDAPVLPAGASPEATAAWLDALTQQARARAPQREVIYELDLLEFPTSKAAAAAAGACYYALPDDITTRVWDDRGPGTVASRVDFCDRDGLRFATPPYHIRAGSERGQVLGHASGVTTIHPFGGSYSFFTPGDVSEPVLVLSYHRPVATVIAKANGAAWEPEV